MSARPLGVPAAALPLRGRPRLQLSLQFAADAAARAHRAVLPRHRVARWIRAALAVPGEITVRIVAAEEARALNRDFRDQDHATNVLTFDYSHAPLVHADLVLCADVVEAEAREQALPLDAHYAHLLVHGTLHAQGHEHRHDEEAEAMEARETEALRLLGFADPYRRADRGA